MEIIILILVILFFLPEIVSAIILASGFILAGLTLIGGCIAAFFGSIYSLIVSD